jgi:hypothetical protein
MTQDNDTPSPSRLTPAQIAQVTDNIQASGEAAGQPPPPLGREPRAVTPAGVEVLMGHLFSNPEIREACMFRRPADAIVDPGEHDLTPLCNVVVQATRNGGPEAQAITAMYAAWAIATLYRLQHGEGK